MSGIIVIEVEGKPFGKQRPIPLIKDGRYRKPITPKETRAFEEEVRWSARFAMRGRSMLRGAITLRLTSTFPFVPSWSQRQQDLAELGLMHPAKKPDLDNIEKAALDALNGIVYGDDAAICEKYSRKIYGARPGLRIEVAELTGESACAFRELTGFPLEVVE
jgi:Holliday junction resolvase RusA-like endonuclease